MTRQANNSIAADERLATHRSVAPLDYAVLRGSNIYFSKTVIVHEFDYRELSGISTSAFGSQFADRLQERFLSLEVMSDSCTVKLYQIQ